ncbi:MAG: HlyD family efflux transporter periplasmic adaptor subunit [Candidatus Paceibacterota bacterium]
MIHKRLFQKYQQFGRRDRYILWTTIAVLFILLIGVLRFTGGSVLDEITRDAQSRKVTVEQVATLSTETTPLSIIGTVRSEKEAILRTESSGTITGVYRNVGDFVAAGAIIAEIKNTGERASVAQAQANLDKVQKGSRNEELSILTINLKNAESDLVNTKRQSINTLFSAYATADDVITRSADQIVSNASSQNPQINITVSENQLETNIETTRVAVEAILLGFKDTRNNLAVEDDLNREYSSTTEGLDVIKRYLDTILAALNTAVNTPEVSSSQIETYKTSVSGARTSILSSLSALATQKQYLDGAESALKIAQENNSKGITGEREEDITSAEAALRVAQANLEKTRVRTPISGRISSLSLSTGDFVSLFEPAAIVSNSNALEITAFITESERNNIAVGNTALIADTLNGVVTSISPGLDPQTKKIQIRIGVTDEGSAITQGASVEVKVTRSRPASSSEIKDIFIPISALKITTTDAFVFTLSSENTLVSHKVTIGRILGDKVEITAGINPEMYIVTDARGLKEKQTVITE